jgi:hypothetical protein
MKLNPQIALELIWISSNEDEIHNRFLYGEEPSESFQSGSPIDNLRITKERMTGIPLRTHQFFRTLQKHGRSKLDQFRT